MTNADSNDGRVFVLTGSGMGRRMGGPKALLLWSDNLPLAVAHARLRQHDCAQTILVTRQSIADSLTDFSEEMSIVVSDAPDEWGPAGSLYVLAKSGKLEHSEELLISPVDMPPISQETVLLLCQALHGTVNALRPVYGGRGGHPVLVRSKVILEHYQRAAVPLRDVLRSLGTSFVDVSVTDPDVVADLDTPDAFKNRLGRDPRFWASSLLMTKGKC